MTQVQIRRQTRPQQEWPCGQPRTRGVANPARECRPPPSARVVTRSSRPVLLPTFRGVGATRVIRTLRHRPGHRVADRPATDPGQAPGRP